MDKPLESLLRRFGDELGIRTEAVKGHVQFRIKEGPLVPGVFISEQKARELLEQRQTHPSLEANQFPHVNTHPYSLG